MRNTLLTLFLLALAAPAIAQTPQAGPETSPATKAFQAAMDRMMTDMGHRFSGNVDQDFVAGMIPHHRGAVEMAQIELQYGKDQALKRLARRIIHDQDREVSFMRQWQQKHPTTQTP